MFHFFRLHSFSNRQTRTSWQLYRDLSQLLPHRLPLVFNEKRTLRDGEEYKRQDTSRLLVSSSVANFSSSNKYFYSNVCNFAYIWHSISCFIHRECTYICWINACTYVACYRTSLLLGNWPIFGNIHIWKGLPGHCQHSLDNVHTTWLRPKWSGNCFGSAFLLPDGPNREIHRIETRSATKNLIPKVFFFLRKSMDFFVSSNITATLFHEKHKK